MGDRFGARSAGAQEVLEARRARGWGTSALAENASVAVDVIERIEHGEPVDPADVTSVRGVLGLPVPVQVAADLREEAYADLLRGAAASYPGTLFLPDVAGMCAAKGLTPATLAEAVEAEEAYTPWPAYPAVAFLIAFAASVVGMLASMALGREPLAGTFLYCTFGSLALAGAFGVCASVVGESAPHRALHGRLVAAEARRKRLRKVGFVLSRDHVTVLRIRKGRIDARTHMACVTPKVRRRWHKDGRHVSVRLKTITDGKLLLPWLERTPELDALVTAWEAGPATPRPASGGVGMIGTLC